MSTPGPVSFVMVGRELLSLDIHPPTTTDPEEPTIFLSSESSELYDLTPAEARALAGYLTAAADAADQIAK